MQTYIQQKFASNISHKSSRTYAERRSRGIFWICFITGIILGIAFFVYLQKNNLSYDQSYIYKHLNSTKQSKSDPASILRTAIRISRNDLTHLFFVFISGFTYFCGAVSGAIVFSKGFMLGFSTLAIIATDNRLISVNIWLFFLIFVLTKYMICCTAVLFASNTYIFSYDFRAIKQKCSILRRTSVTYKFVFSFIVSLGASLLTYLVYCFLLIKI